MAWAALVVVLLWASGVDCARREEDSEFPRARVLVAARCSGSSATLAATKKLLAAHGVRVFDAACELEGWDELLKHCGGAAALPAHLKLARRANASLVFESHGPSLTAEAAVFLKEATFVSMYRRNALDRAICSIRDGIDQSDGGRRLGWPLDVATGLRVKPGFDRRRQRKDAPWRVEVDAEALLETLLGVWAGVEAQQAAQLNDLLGLDDVTAVAYEDLFAFEYADAELEVSRAAWRKVLAGFQVRADDAVLAKWLDDKRGSHPTPLPHSATISNYDALRRTFDAEPKLRALLRDEDDDDDDDDDEKHATSNDAPPRGGASEEGDCFGTAARPTLVTTYHKTGCVLIKAVLDSVGEACGCVHARLSAPWQGGVPKTGQNNRCPVSALSHAGMNLDACNSAACDDALLARFNVVQIRREPLALVVSFYQHHARGNERNRNDAYKRAYEVISTQPFAAGVKHIADLALDAELPAMSRMYDRVLAQQDPRRAISIRLEDIDADYDGQISRILEIAGIPDLAAHAQLYDAVKRHDVSTWDTAMIQANNHINRGLDADKSEVRNVLLADPVLLKQLCQYGRNLGYDYDQHDSLC